MVEAGPTGFALKVKALPAHNGPSNSGFKVNGRDSLASTRVNRR
jgi:hypothetical protein